MRLTTFVLIVFTLTLLGVRAPARGQTPDVPPTPGPQDVPRPVPAGTELAGSNTPDIVRFLNARRATAPSPAPDGSRVAFETSISGEPQLWVVPAVGGWPHQLTFGRPVHLPRLVAGRRLDRLSTTRTSS